VPVYRLYFDVRLCFTQSIAFGEKVFELSMSHKLYHFIPFIANAFKGHVWHLSVSSDRTSRVYCYPLDCIFSPGQPTTHPRP